jgi:hypothetical protein
VTKAQQDPQGHKAQLAYKAQLALREFKEIKAQLAYKAQLGLRESKVTKVQLAYRGQQGLRDTRGLLGQPE